MACYRGRKDTLVLAALLDAEEGNEAGFGDAKYSPSHHKLGLGKEKSTARGGGQGGKSGREDALAPGATTQAAAASGDPAKPKPKGRVVAGLVGCEIKNPSRCVLAVFAANGLLERPGSNRKTGSLSQKLATRTVAQSSVPATPFAQPVDIQRDLLHRLSRLEPVRPPG